jgi:cold shock CspA family protein
VHLERFELVPSGTVKLLVVDRGYGFLAVPESADVFFHHSTLAAHGFKKLVVGQPVEFELAGGAKRSAKGPRAKVVTPLPSPAETPDV